MEGGGAAVDHEVYVGCPLQLVLVEVPFDANAENEERVKDAQREVRANEQGKAREDQTRRRWQGLEERWKELRFSSSCGVCWPPSSSLWIPMRKVKSEARHSEGTGRKRVLRKPRETGARTGECSCLSSA